MHTAAEPRPTDASVAFLSVIALQMLLNMLEFAYRAHVDQHSRSPSGHLTPAINGDMVEAFTNAKPHARSPPVFHFRSHHAALWLIVCVFGTVGNAAQPLPDWTRNIRSDHPRLFFNAQSWPAVKQRALSVEEDWYRNIKARIDRLETKSRASARLEVRDLGAEAAMAAFVFRVTDDDRYLTLARKCMQASVEHYEACYEQRKTVNWYSTSRVHTIMAWDWLYDELPAAQRRDIMTRLVQTIGRVIKAKPRIYRENMSGHNTGFYGVRNCLWFIGCTAFGTGIETETVNNWLVWGHDENHKLLAHRQQACGDDGGGASPSLGYVFGAYPWSEQNFFYTWLSATGENIAPAWPHGASLANYVTWNWIAAPPTPMQFGYGDTPHTDNRLPISQLYTHMANIRHLYGQAAPEAAGLARHIQATLPKGTYSRSWFIYPFLLAELESSPNEVTPDNLPNARHFETMGQVFMRSGVGVDDTYCLFTCGGILKQHRHFDALNFVIYHRGFQALDSGTRYDEFTNGQHLANYFAQTVAHNCVVIHQEGEPPARYWGGTVEGNHGGQHHQLGSIVTAFETNEDFVYVAGDATACYQHGEVSKNSPLPEKCKLATRQIVFLLPNHFIIFDRVTTTDPSYRKEWLLHTAHQPIINGQKFHADHGEGRIWCQTLLPKNAKLVAVGGPGNEFVAAGTNWAIEAPRLTPQQLDMIGRWRVEVSPVQEAKEDTFLHVIQVGDQSLEAMSHGKLIEDNNTCGVRLTNEQGTWTVTFNTTGKIGGHISRSGSAGFSRQLTADVTPQSGLMIRPQSGKTESGGEN